MSLCVCPRHGVATNNLNQRFIDPSMAFYLAMTEAPSNVMTKRTFLLLPNIRRERRPY